MSINYEIIGYLGSIIVAISLSMSSIIRLRIFGLLGAIVFVFYGYTINAIPIMLLNIFISGIHIYRLLYIRNNKEYFSILEVSSDSKYWDAFVGFYSNEIRNQRPDFNFTESREGKLCFFLTANAVVAGVFQADYLSDGRLLVELDYVIPRYQEFKIGRSLFSHQKQFFSSKGIVTICSKSMTSAHNLYLQKMNFLHDKKENIYFLDL